MFHSYNDGRPLRPERPLLEHTLVGLGRWERQNRMGLLLCFFAGVQVRSECQNSKLPVGGGGGALKGGNKRITNFSVILF